MLDGQIRKTSAGIYLQWRTNGTGRAGIHTGGTTPATGGKRRAGLLERDIDKQYTQQDVRPVPLYIKKAVLPQPTQTGFYSQSVLHDRGAVGKSSSRNRPVQAIYMGRQQTQFLSDYTVIVESAGISGNPEALHERRM